MIRIKIGRNGNIGNKMFQYMYCRYLQLMIRDSQIENYRIPEFSLVSPERELSGRILEIRDGHRHCMSSVAHLLNHKIYDHLYFDGYVQRLEYYPSRDFCSALFQTDHQTDLTHLGAGTLVINVRGAEVLSPTHPDYGPVPVDFFSQMAEQTGLTPVLMGQIGNDPYSEEIRKRFAGCTFLPSVSAISDFQIMRNASNIVLSVSTFSWIASWLSSTLQNIYLPIAGLFNPLQRRDVDLLPISDPRYHFYEFPINKWRATKEQQDALVSYGKLYRCMAISEVKNVIRYG